MRNLFIALLAALLLLSGTCVDTTPCPPCPCPCPPNDTTVTPPPDTFRAGSLFIGINCNVWQPADKQAAFHTTRLYLPTGWTYTAAGFRGQPFLNGGKQFFGSDEYLSHMKGKGVDVLLTLMDAPNYLNGQTGDLPFVNNYAPVPPGSRRDDPASYAAFADIYKAFAMRYGSRTHPPGSYALDNAPPRWNGDGPQVHKSGLGVLKFIEVGNEWDRWWDRGTPKYVTPQEHAALLLAAYDSIKAADPALRVVMAGLTNHDLPYLVAMQEWFAARGRRFAADVVNVHHYASLGNRPGVHPPTWLPNSAAAPELDPDFATITAVVAWARGLGLPVWVSEYGYDTQPGSQMYITPYASLTSEAIQAQMVVRATLEYLRLGVQRTYLFTCADEPNPNGGTFTSSGVLRGEPAGYAEKPSFAAMRDLCASLRGATAVRDKSTQDFRVVEFDTPGGIVVYYWLPTASGNSLQASIGGQVVTVTETPKKL